ncbi:uncharacterized protein B0T15DRAFT_33974 [Chaetomium strumarium]|uniref:Uncharacterized protein n=1 Tax=Chaetomium strumarium TaxID=1170767 RepID=A0AAJ0M690_9PEZI|nr:hypothetical protein B0T15DRAFT_33974 [Chaetomium strumarium]
MASSGKKVRESEPAESLDVVETPTSPSSGLACSRFEFETGRANDGTKILMVEWDAAAGNPDGGSEKAENGEKGEKRERRQDDGSGWEVSWEGKGAVLPVRDVDPEPGSHTRRVYFLLPPGAAIPALVTIAHGGQGNDEAGVVLRTKPMPAIFPAALTSKQEAGRRGVLHTIWAKRRLDELQAEIAAEMRANGESVGLEMAMQERQWIVDHFGLAPDPGMPQPTKLHIPQSSASPASPRSPVGGKLGEKLRGLKLATSPAELAAASQVAKSAQPPRTQAQPTIGPVLPPATTGVAISSSGGGGVASLDAIVGSGAAPAAGPGTRGADPTEEDLFALPLSPRSPEMKKSPFSLL